MKTHSIQDFYHGWIVGNFAPSLHRTTDFEVGLKSFKTSDREPNHFQHIATEATLVVSGHIRMGTHFLKAGEILVVEAGEVCDFEAMEDSTVLAIKWPSLPDDKVLAD